LASEKLRRGARTRVQAEGRKVSWLYAAVEPSERENFKRAKKEPYYQSQRKLEGDVVFEIN